jgi:hypothetical protein
MMGVVIHEVGHNFFNDCEFRRTSMDMDGWRLNSFMEFMAEDELGTNFPSRRGPAKNIVPYMSGPKFLGTYHVKFREYNSVW